MDMKDNLYNLEEIWKNPERKCQHDKEVYCEECLKECKTDGWPYPYK